jgi:NADH-quinone oxidoreductase subunit F
LFQAPTLVNNVETIACLPLIIRHGAAWFTDRGLALDGGTRLFSVSGAVVRPGVYEMPVGTRLRDLIEGPAGGLPPGRTIKAVIPGGLSAPLLRPEETEIPLDFDSLARAGSILGSGAVVVIDETTPILDVLRIVARFYAHESCGKCTPCRIGTAWIHKIVERLAAGGGRREDLETIAHAARSMAGRTLCPMGEAAAYPILAIVAKFHGELEAALHD